MSDHSSFEPVFIEWLIDVALSESTDVDDLGVQELADLWARCDALGSIVATVIAKVQDRLAPMLRDRPVLLSDGTILKHKPSPSRTKWRNAELLETLLDNAGRWVVDDVSGERVRLVDPSKLRGMIEPTHALTKLTAHGISHTDYCVEQWTDKVEAHR